MRSRIAFVAGLGVAYLLATDHGRAQLQKVKTWASGAWSDPRVQDYVSQARDQATEFAKHQGHVLREQLDEATKSFGGEHAAEHS